MNPPNCPQFRPIEKYWAIVRGILKRTKGSAKNDVDLRSKWNRSASEVSKDVVQNLMGGIALRAQKYLLRGQLN